MAATPEGVQGEKEVTVVIRRAEEESPTTDDWAAVIRWGTQRMRKRHEDLEDDAFSLTMSEQEPHSVTSDTGAEDVKDET